MNGLTNKYDSRLHQVATLMMLAAYLFFAFGDIAIEAMHRGIHAWQNAASTHQSHSHTHTHQHGHHHHHSHGHQHEVLGFLKQLVNFSTKEKSPDYAQTFDIDKHLLETHLLQTIPFTSGLLKKPFKFSHMPFVVCGKKQIYAAFLR